MSLYDYADRCVKDLNKRNLRLFGRLKTLKFDELNVLQNTVDEIYDQSAKIAKKRYKDIYADAYEFGFGMLKAASLTLEESVLNDWLLDMLEDYDAVTHYRFNDELERKKSRTFEALVSTAARRENRYSADSNEVDKSLKLWTLQVSQYADRSVTDGVIQAFRDAGVEKVKWITEIDGKECQNCRDLNGKVFTIDTVPSPQHYRCRCTLKPV